MQNIKKILTGWLLVSTVGCANLSDVRYEHSQWARTRSAWRAIPDCAKEHCYPADYRKGWQDGFFDVTTGGKGCPPIVAPECYWKPSQILDNCDNRRNAYYSGWQDGAAHASQFPDTNTIRIWSSCECPLPSCQACPPACECPSGKCTGECGGYASTLTPTPAQHSIEMIESSKTTDLPLPLEIELKPMVATPEIPIDDAGLVMGSGLTTTAQAMTQATLATRQVAPFDVKNDGLIESSNVVMVSSVQPGATVAAKQSIEPQQFDPATAFEKKTMPVVEKPAAQEISQEQPKSTVVEAKPIKMDAQPSGGTVELATGLQL